MVFRTIACASLLSFSSLVVAKEPPSIIYLIGDGMGTAYTTGYRLFADDPSTKVVETSVFDKMLVGTATTYPDDDKDNVTDSAAAATALAAQTKTFNGAIGVNKEHQPVKTVLEFARERGYTTGLAVTSQINHATPAAFVAHVDSRQSYDDIADQYVDSTINGKPKVDLMLGGGQSYFVRKNRNLIAELQHKNYTYVDDIHKLSGLTTLPAIGLFAEVGMPPALGSEHPLRLAEMTTKALELLPTQRKPFFLMLEASQVDWCGHANDIACAMAEMRDMAETMSRIKAFIDTHPNTLLVVTADHSTGGLSVGARDEYIWRPQVIKAIKRMPSDIAELMEKQIDNWETVWVDNTSITLKADEKDLIASQLKNLVDSRTGGKETKEIETNKKALVGSLLKIIDKRSGTGWTTKGHTGEDVQVFAYGYQAKLFAGTQDNTEIAKKLFGLIK